MIIQKLELIKELAQDFLESPRITFEGNILTIVIDYETEDGIYSEKKIIFYGSVENRHISEENIKPEVIEASNYICLVLDSEWLREKNISHKFKHFIIYFEEYGFYEIIAKRYEY